MNHHRPDVLLKSCKFLTSTFCKFHFIKTCNMGRGFPMKALHLIKKECFTASPNYPYRPKGCHNIWIWPKRDCSLELSLSLEIALMGLELGTTSHPFCFLPQVVVESSEWSALILIPIPVWVWWEPGDNLVHMRTSLFHPQGTKWNTSNSLVPESLKLVIFIWWMWEWGPLL